MKKTVKSMILLGSLCSTAIAVADVGPTYNNMFISYYTPANVASMVDYAKAKQLGGLIEWTINGDAAFGDSHSLLKAALNEYMPDPSNPPMIMSYWTDWSVYTGDANSHAIPETAYPIPGSLNSNGNVVSNQDLTDKLQGINVLAYSFVEAEPKSYTYYDANGNKHVMDNSNGPIGTLYFADPWADLNPTDSAFCANNDICMFTARARGNNDFQNNAKMGNFEAFANLSRGANSPLGPLKKVISVGGYGHNDSFEDVLGNPAYINNFATSAQQILDHYHLDGIDLDYENPQMTHQQSREFLQLVQTLRATLGNNKLITVTTLSDPNYLDGSRQGQYGYAPAKNGEPSVLAQLAQVANKINLMTYDFHGAYDYDPKGTGLTGFLTNLFKPNDILPPGYDPQFSVDGSVQTALTLGVPANKIVVGIPAYGRSLANVDDHNGGLFQPITQSTIIPAGDLDAKGCSEAVPLQGASCSGAFQYKYIVNEMLNNGFTEQNRTDDQAGVSNGTTAYAKSWTTQIPTGYQLTIENSGIKDLSSGLYVSIGTKQGEEFKPEFGPTEYLAPNTKDNYNLLSSISTKDINGKTGLVVYFSTYPHGPAGYCDGKLNLNKDSTISIDVIPFTIPIVKCSIK